MNAEIIVGLSMYLGNSSDERETDLSDPTHNSISLDYLKKRSLGVSSKVHKQMYRELTICLTDLTLILVTQIHSAV
jgi:hypothetical protein